VIFPGGFGTLDELTEAMTLVQTKKHPPFPIVLVGSAYWQGLLSWMRDIFVASRTIDIHDLDMVTIVDTAEEACALICRFSEKNRP
jgi:predicted Rossmann-fold nucleotide-binding protein